MARICCDAPPTSVAPYLQRQGSRCASVFALRCFRPLVRSPTWQGWQLPSPSSSGQFRLEPMVQYPDAKAGVFRLAHPAMDPAANKHVIVTRSINTSLGLMI